MKIVGKSFLFFLLVMAMAEIFLRVFYIMKSPADRAVVEFFRRVDARIYSHWQAPNANDPFLPPYKVFADRDFDNSQRLAEIAPYASIPSAKSERSKDWLSYDFLQPEERRKDTTYHIHINSLGFRGTENAAEKAPGVFRIIALGDYHTFGHGVDDDQTYSAVLEKSLNQHAVNQAHFEVWNGGRHAASAIIGLARMNDELFSYKPDLFIVDYGFVDPLVWGDDLMTSSMYFPATINGFARKTLPILEHSLLFFNLQFRSFFLSFPAHARQFQSVLRKIKAVASDHHVPIIFVRESESCFRPEIYTELADRQTAVVDVTNVFNSHPPDRLQQLNPEKTWISEVPKFARDSKVFAYWPYRQDLFQLSALGHRVVADALEEKIKLIRSSEPRHSDN